MTTATDPTTVETLREAARLAAAYEQGWRSGVRGASLYEVLDEAPVVTDVLAWGVYQCGHTAGAKLRAS